MMRRNGFTVAAVLVLLGTSWGQNSSSSEQETIRALANEVRELKMRLAAVESQLAKKPEAPSTSTSQAAAATVAEPATPQFTVNEVQRGIRFQGFGEVTYKANDQHARELPTFGFSGGPNGNFSVADFDMFLTSRINEKTQVLAELVFGQGDAQSFDIDLERALLIYNHNDYLRMSFGRFHTATSYYNSAFHSGRWLQTPVNRPLVVEFANDGGMLPTQAVGTSITGKVPSGSLGLNYIFEYGTSDTIRPNINDFNGSEIDESNGNGITIGAYAKPDAVPGLDIGGSFYHDRLSPATLPFAINQSIASVHAVYNTPNTEFINEAFLIHHQIAGSQVAFNTPAFYTLLSRKFGEHWRPYFLYQYANASVISPIFSDVGLRHGPTAGARYDFNTYVGFKLQYERTIRRQLPSINGLATQLAFRF